MIAHAVTKQIRQKITVEYTTSDRTAHKNFTPLRYGEAMLKIW